MESIPVRYSLVIRRSVIAFGMLVRVRGGIRHILYGEYELSASIGARTLLSPA